jgi:RHS repeat-associated protein
MEDNRMQAYLTEVVSEYLWQANKTACQENGVYRADLQKLISLPAIFSNALAQNNANVPYYFHADHLSGASMITNSTGSFYQALAYCPFGESLINERIGNYDEMYKFTGYERDQESGLDYANARYYNSDLGIMITTDPMWNKYPSFSSYNYCGNNPVMMVDPTGMEGIVVSGGEYDSDTRYKYNFIEPAITRLKELKAAGGSEPITWAVMTAGYSDKDIASFQSIAADLGVGFQSIGSADEFTNYLNSKSVGSSELSEARTGDQITSMTVFGHGFVGSAEFAYNQDNQQSFSWGIDNAKQLKAGAFNNAVVDFYTCNAATNYGGGKSLGYTVAQQTGSTVTGYRGQSTYSQMNNGQSSGAKWDRFWNGFNTNGSMRLPQAGSGATRIRYVQPSKK